MLHQIDKIKFVEALEPATNAGSLTGKWLSMKNILKILVVVQITQGAAPTVTLTINQAPLVNGAGGTPITEVVPIWSNLDTGTDDILVKRTRAVNYTTDADTKNKIVIFEICADKLDVNTHTCINIVAGASSGSNTVSAMYVCELRYSGADLDSN